MWRMKLNAFNVTVQGASHIKKNKECQDASKSFCCEDYAIAVVCDGHGGEDYIRSATGSEKACQIALKNIQEFIAQIDRETLRRQSESAIRTLEASIITEWNKQIEEHWKANPITDEELSVLSDKAKRRYMERNVFQSAYGTTLIAAVIAKDFWFCFQVGDGKCVWISRESQFAFLQLDEKCFLNATTSLCDSDALEHFHNYFSEDLPAAVFVGTDGVDDSFKNEDQLNNFYKAICYSFANSDTDKAQDELKDYLPRLSQKGSADDISVAAVLNMDILPDIELVKEYNRADEEAKKIQAEQEEEKRNNDLKKAYEQKQRLQEKVHEKQETIG